MYDGCMNPTCKQPHKWCTCFHWLSEQIDADQVDRRAPIGIFCFFTNGASLSTQSAWIYLYGSSWHGDSCRIGKPVALSNNVMSAYSNSVPTSGWKDSFGLENRFSSHFQPQLVSRVNALHIKLRCNRCFEERTEPRGRRVAVAAIRAALQQKTGTGWSPTITSRPTVRPEDVGNAEHSWFKGIKSIQLTVHGVNEISQNGSSQAFPEVSLWQEAVEHSGALSCADYRRVLFRSTWVKVPFSWI